MSEEDTSPWIGRYRLTVSDEPTPAIDQVIFEAAGRRALRVRMLRGSIAVLGLAALLILPLWGAHVIRGPQAGATSGYGRQEGVSRYYLLNVASYTRPGSVERK